jgi:CheY-like chemotaxis protein
MVSTLKSPCWRPVAHVAISNLHAARQIVQALHRQGYQVFEHLDGIELVGALSDHIERRHGKPPDVIVADVRLRGCSGVTVAAGLRDLGVATPVILVASPDDPVPERELLWRVDPEEAVTRVPEIARRWAPVRILEPEPVRLQA